MKCREFHQCENLWGLRIEERFFKHLIPSRKRKESSFQLSVLVTEWSLIGAQFKFTFGQVRSLLLSASERRVVEGFQLALERLLQFEKKLENVSRNRLDTPVFYLSLALHLIRSRSDKSFYRDYANLLNCAYQTFGREDIECSEEAVRKTYQRFIKRNPEAFSLAIAPGVAVSLSMILDGRNQ